MELKNAFRRVSASTALAAICLASAGSLMAQNNTFLLSNSSLTFSYQAGATNQPPTQDFTVLSSGTNGQFTVTPSTNGGGNWLSGFQLQNVTPGTFRAAVFTNGLAPGTYTGQYTISGPNFTNATVPVTLRITTTSELSFTPSGAVEFTVPAGSGLTTKQVTVGSSGSPLTYQAAFSTQSGGGWLSVAPLTGTTESPSGVITIGANPGALGVGTYRGFISAQAPGASNTQGSVAITLDVILNVVNAPQLTALPSALNFNFQTGGSVPAAQTLSIGSSAGNLAFNVAVDPGPTPNWLTVNPLGGTTPAALSVAVNPSGLPAGTYNGKITITAAGSSGPVVVNVTLTVSNTALLNVQPSSLLFTYQSGQAVPPNQTLNLSSTGTQLPFTITPSIITPAGGGWLFAVPLTGTAGSSPTAVTVAVNPGSLAPGTYTGTLTVNSQTAGNPSQVVNVTLVVSAAVTLSLNVNSLSYTAQAGGLPPVSQTFNISSSDAATPIPFQITTSTTDGNKWLSTSVTSGTTPLQNVGVIVNQAGLPPGNYTGTVTVTGSGVASATTQVLTVNLTVTSPAYAFTPASLTFNQVTNGAVPATQTITVNTATNGATLVASASSTNNWLSVIQSSTTTPATLTVTANGAALAAGTYQGQINIDGSAGHSVIPVTLTVTAGTPLVLAPTSLSFDFQLGGAVPAAQGMVVSTSGTNVSFTTAAATTSGGNWLIVTPASGQTPSQLSISVSPAGLAAGTYNGTITVTPTGVNAGPAAVANVKLTITAPAPPSLTGFTNAASFAVGPAVPGMLVTLFGTAMGPSTAANATAAGGFFETKISDVRVLFDGTPAPLIYVSATQVSAIVPYAIFGRLSTTVQVEYLGVRSNSLILRVDPSLPGLFSANSSGKGGGAILNQDNSLNTPNNPATKTQAIVLYATGEGRTTPDGIDGKIISSDLRKPVLPVSVKVGGVDCTVEYYGSAPGLVSGVMQVNVRLNSSVPSGNVPVVLTVGTATSQDGLTVAIR